MTRRLEYGEQKLLDRIHRAPLLAYPVTRNQLQPIRMCFAESPFMMHYGLKKGQSSMELSTLQFYSFVASFVNRTPVYPAELVLLSFREAFSHGFLHHHHHHHHHHLLLLLLLLLLLFLLKSFPFWCL
jgi:hypothetical protein